MVLGRGVRSRISSKKVTTIAIGHEASKALSNQGKEVLATQKRNLCPSGTVASILESNSFEPTKGRKREGRNESQSFPGGPPRPDMGPGKKKNRNGGKGEFIHARGQRGSHFREGSLARLGRNGEQRGRGFFRKTSHWGGGKDKGRTQGRVRRET